MSARPGTRGRRERGERKTRECNSPFGREINKNSRRARWRLFISSRNAKRNKTMQGARRRRDRINKREHASAATSLSYAVAVCCVTEACPQANNLPRRRRSPGWAQGRRGSYSSSWMGWVGAEIAGRSPHHDLAKKGAAAKHALQVLVHCRGRVPRVPGAQRPRAIMCDGKGRKTA